MPQLENRIAAKVRSLARADVALLSLFWLMTTSIYLLWCVALAIGAGVHWLQLTDSRLLAGAIGVGLGAILSRGYFPVGWAKALADHHQYVSRYEADCWRAARCHPLYYAPSPSDAE